MVSTILGGIFVAVVAGLILYYVFGIGRPHKSQEKDDSKPKVIKETKGSLRDNLSPGGIIKSIDSHKPYLRQGAKESYKGLEISWRLTFHSVNELSKGIAHVTFLVNNTYPWVYANIPLDRYPELKVINEKTEIIVKGQIQEVGSNTITLQNAALTF